MFSADERQAAPILVAQQFEAAGRHGVQDWRCEQRS
jgi:hypothetical protein